VRNIHLYDGSRERVYLYRGGRERIPLREHTPYTWRNRFTHRSYARSVGFFDAQAPPASTTSAPRPRPVASPVLYQHLAKVRQMLRQAEQALRSRVAELEDAGEGTLVGHDPYARQLSNRVDYLSNDLARTLKQIESVEGA
jgi:hypothetical protein